jgi:hypothetical protein
MAAAMSSRFVTSQRSATHSAPLACNFCAAAATVSQVRDASTVRTASAHSQLGDAADAATCARDERDLLSNSTVRPHRCRSRLARRSRTDNGD